MKAIVYLFLAYIQQFAALMLCFIYFFCTRGLDLSWLLSSVYSCLQPGQHRDRLQHSSWPWLEQAAVIEKWMDRWSSKAGIQCRLIWIVFKWKPGRRVRQVWWILISHHTLLETVARNCHLRGSLCGTVQIIGGAQWITPITTTSTICYTHVTPFWSSNYTAAILTLGLSEALTCVYRQLERHQAFI